MTNSQLGVFIGDDDSANIKAVRNAYSQTVVKHSDANHISRGATNMLFKLDKRTHLNKELTSNAIKYLHRCFTYAVGQNRGNPSTLASAIKNIPFHAFNVHDNCGSWCGFHKDPEHYVHSTVLGGFANDKLFAELKTIFNKLADNADKFAAGALSQANESLNSVMARKAPKSTCYSLSESADFRFACTVSQKNDGEKYVQQILEKAQLSPGKYLSEHVQRITKIRNVKKNIAKSISFKARRQLLRKERSQLRNRRHAAEGITYKSHMGLLENSSESQLITTTDNLPPMSDHI